MTEERVEKAVDRIMQKVSPENREKIEELYSIDDERRPPDFLTFLGRSTAQPTEGGA